MMTSDPELSAQATLTTSFNHPSTFYMFDCQDNTRNQQRQFITDIFISLSYERYLSSEPKLSIFLGTSVYWKISSGLGENKAAHLWK
jgi:hypothetical protein